MVQPDYIFGQFRETARCRDAQRGDGVCCAFAPQLVIAINRVSDKTPTTKPPLRGTDGKGSIARACV